MSTSSDDIDEEFTMNSMDIFEWLDRFGYKRKHSGSPKARYQDFVRGTDKLVITLRGKGGFSWFFNNSTGEHGTIINLVQIEMGLPSIGHAKKEIRKLYGDMRPGRERKKPVKAPFPKPQPVVDDEPDPHKIDLSRKWNSFKDMVEERDAYLLNRGINRDTIREFFPELKIDYYGNPCFRHKYSRRVTGWEYRDIRPHVDCSSMFSKGGLKSFFNHRTGGEIEFIVITEGAIKSLAFHQIYQLGNALHLAAAGRYSKLQESLLSQLFEKMPNAKIICAADNDAAGDAYFEQQKILAGPERKVYRMKPESVKDWDDLLVNKTN